jgi:hypothetical protein
MSIKSARFLRTTVLAGLAFSLAAPQVRAGDRVIGTTHPTIRYVAAPIVHMLPPAETVSISLTPAVVKEPVYVQLRGPDGQVRSFPIEGGREAITYTSVVLHPGQSLTIHLAAAK